MSNTVGPQSGLLSGEITFYDSSQAPLKSASYELTVTQSIDIGPEGDNPPDYTATQSLEVTASRFSIQPTDLQSVYPPGNHAGNFAEVLPHVVLTQDLPWARPIVPDDITDNTPWLALLVVHDSEKEKIKGPVTETVADLVDPSNNTVVPDLPNLTSEEEKTQVQLMQVDLTFFKAIAPSLSDLPFLTHVRNVDTTDKVTGLANGMWSMVVANRLPASSEDSAHVNTVYLVSLEGHSQHLAGSSVSGDMINLAVLAQWQFTVSSFPGDFLSLLQNIRKTDQNQVLRMPSESVAGDSYAQKTVEEAISLGFVPTQTQLLEGEQTTAWLRGVLTPWPNREDPLETSYSVSDHAIRYNPENGMFDFTYASAWQIGRLLALSDSNFVNQMQNWRQQQTLEQQAKMEAGMVEHQLKATNLAPQQNLYSSPTSSAAHMLNHCLCDVTVPQINQRRMRACKNSADHLPDKEKVQSAVAEGADPLEYIMAQLGFYEGKE